MLSRMRFDTSIARNVRFQEKEYEVKDKVSRAVL